MLLLVLEQPILSQVLADAMMDSLPLVVFTGQVGTGVIGTDAFQEADIFGITTTDHKT